MKIDISDLLNGKKRTLYFDFDVAIDAADESCPLPPPDVRFTEPVAVSGSIVDHAGYMELNADVRAAYTALCSRCLDEVNGCFELSFSRTVVVEGGLENPDDADDYVVAVEGVVDFDRALLEELMLTFPPMLLCSEDCRGLCSRCGGRLTGNEAVEGICGECFAKEEPDPRLAPLKAMLDRLKAEENPDEKGEPDEDKTDAEAEN